MLEGFLTDSSAGDHEQQSRVNIGATLTRLALSFATTPIAPSRTLLPKGMIASSRSQRN